MSLFKHPDGSLVKNQERVRMRTFMIFLYVLGLNYSQASGQENSTKVYYFILRTEASAIPNITRLLGALAVDVNNDDSSINVHVKDLDLTTECDTLKDYTRCTCRPEHIWSADVCDNDPSCCEETTMCLFQTKPTPMCFPNTRALITGSLHLPGQHFYDSLADPNSPRFRELSEMFEEQMKKIYSTFEKFDSLKITKFRRGSIIADFELNVNSHVKSVDLTNKTLTLQSAINGTISLETKGLVAIFVHNPVPYNNRTHITCVPREEMSPIVQWELKKEVEKHNGINQIEAFGITNGYESKLTSTSTHASVFLHNTTEYWAGEYICTFSPVSSSVTIVHKARKILDVALLPKIYIFADPPFPRCIQTSTEKVKFRVTCEIRRSSENYTVTWLSEGNQTEVVAKEEEYPDFIMYTAETTAGCLTQKAPHLTCRFRNRLDQEKNATLRIYVIYAHSSYCKAERDWPDVIAGFTVRLRCPGQSGERFRKCSANATWEHERENCVNRDLNNILEDTENIAKGLGSVDNNSASIFYRLSASTNNTERIDTFSNVDTSINILARMKALNHTFQQAILNDFIQASSNILSVSPQFDNEDNDVAVKYLDSVEGLIERTAITDTLNRNTSNVQLVSCSAQKSHCRNTVFNVTVTMDNSLSGVVKTAGFMNLAEYLPNQQAKKNKPNSIVVSTTLQSNTTLSGVVELDFQLIKERPRNHKMNCVFWDAAARDWSSAGCDWGGPDKEGLCVCKHLSSFTILMSKEPVDIPYLEEITNAGLAVSIISLVVCLVIEALVWNSIAKTKILYLRHTAHVNISLCLLIADSCFLASQSKMKANWCQVFVVLKHFCYLAMFFWMLFLSLTLLHKTIFIFHELSRKRYLGLSFFLGYICPALIVATTFISLNSGERGLYYTTEGCWLIYKGFMEGSIFTFILPVGVIVIVNILCMAVVMMKLLENPKAELMSPEDDKKAAKSILRAIVLLTPIFGLTWIVGFFVLMVDIAAGAIAVTVHYTFTLLNAFQGLFILLTTCLGEKQVREELLRRLTTTHPQSRSERSLSETSLKSK